MSAESVLRELRSHGDPAAVKGMARFGITVRTALGVSVPTLRSMARKLRKDHALALALWESGVHEARILSSMVDDPAKVTEGQMEKWAGDFDSWDVCDQCCSNLFDETKFAFEKATEWAERDQEFVKRAGFVLMAALAVHDKEADDRMFVSFFELIEKGAADERNFVKKAVNWALRQIGKRNINLNAKALRVAERISKQDSPAARWVAMDAIRELRSEAVRKRLGLTSGA
jgi:3-methyladenine DNA glycosylase AlkD